LLSNNTGLQPKRNYSVGQSRNELAFELPLHFLLPGNSCPAIAYPGTETSSLKHGARKRGEVAEKSTNERQEFDSACIHRGIDPNGAGTDSLLLFFHGPDHRSLQMFRTRLQNAGLNQFVA
jgi:hypothetical protein